MHTIPTKQRAGWAVLALMLALALAMPCALSEASPFAGGDGTEAAPYEIETAAQLDGIRDHLDSHFRLTADIDLSGYASWTPLGLYLAKDAAAGDYTADEAVAFTGSFDGNGHTISNLRIDRDDLSSEDMSGTGLFGCIAGHASVQNLTLEDANVASTGSCVATLVGMAMSAHEEAVASVTLKGANHIAGAGSVGGLVGSAQDTNIVDCTAMADVVMTAVGNGAGVLGGGLEGGVITGCSATGTVTAVESMEYDGMVMGSLGIGGLAGCAFDALEVSDCTAEDVTITVGEAADMVGGLLGYSGLVNEGNFVTDPEGFTRIVDCQAVNVQIVAGSGATRIGGIVGSGFSGGAYTGYYPASSAMHIIRCTASGSIAADEEAIVGAILGYAYQNCAVVSCDASGLSGTTHQIGAADAAQAVSLSDM